MAADRVLIIDRDGVINQDSDDYIKSLDEWLPLPGSIEAIARLSHAGFRVAVASNQSGLARGLLSLNELNAMHRRLRELLSEQGGRIEMIAFCPHAPGEDCNCRKPRPGMLLDIGARLSVDIGGAPFIGDSLSDVDAARAAGMEPWLVRTGKGERTLGYSRDRLSGVRVFENLRTAADALLAQR